MVQFELCISHGVIPKSPRFSQPAEASPGHSVVAGDPSLRLKNGYAQHDAIDERACHQNFKLHPCWDLVIGVQNPNHPFRLLLITQLPNFPMTPQSLHARPRPNVGLPFPCDLS